MGVSAVKIRGPFRGPTGYEHHVREFVRELHNQGVAIQLEHVPAWSVSVMPDGFLDPWYEMLTEPVDANIALQFCMPHQLVPHDDLIDVNYTMFESNRIPAFWAQLGRQIDWTIVPNEFSWHAWIDSGVPSDRVRTCPLGVRSELFAQVHEPLPIELPNGRAFASYGTRFLNVAAWDIRKNAVGLICAWIKATKASDDAALVVKMGLMHPDQSSKVPELLERCTRMARKRLDEAAPVHIFHHVLTDDEMPRLFAAGTHYFSLSHGEGWDLPMMEAIATGLIPIAPDHSAYQTYLDPTVALMIPSREIPAVPPRTDSWFNGLTWWLPDLAVAVATIRAILDDGLAPPASGRDRVLGEYTWERATRCLIEIMQEAERITPFG